MLAIALATATGQANAGNAVEDPFLVDYYRDGTAVSCRTYLTANGARLAAYQWWMLGFASGARHDAAAVQPVEVNRLLDRLEEHCRANPSKTLFAAARALVARKSAQ
jgi:hypothetical protein